jgi:serralysin
MITSADLQLIRNADPGAKLPGIDTPVGNPLPTKSLKSCTTITQNRFAPISWNPTNNAVYVYQNGAVLSGINFGTASVVIAANNVTIKDCTFTGTTGYGGVMQKVGYSNAVVEDCSFTGNQSPTEDVAAFVQSYNYITVKDNSFIDTPFKTVRLASGTVTGNFISGGGYERYAHCDAIWVYASTGATNISDNFIDWTANPGTASSTNNAVRITTDVGQNINDVNVTGNWLLGGGFTVFVGGPNNGKTITNVSITKNYIGFGLYGSASASPLTNTIVDYTNRNFSTSAQAAYLAAGLPTTKVIAATGPTGNITSDPPGIPPPTTLFGNGYQIGMVGSLGETNFVGGFGRQYMGGGQGANIFTYLSIADSSPLGPDLVTNFDPAKDVIDLSRIDADIMTPGLQNFSFIGTAPFSGSGGQLRYQQDPAHNSTMVEADLVGDSTPDLEIQVSGLLTLSAADFALTPAQSSADMANGAALSETHVNTPDRWPFEYAYTNVRGRSYSSFETFYSSGSDRAADDLNLSSSSNELVLYDHGLTVNRGSGAEVLWVTNKPAPLGYHANETIDASSAGGEKFVLTTGFGNETIGCFATTGTNADTVQLATSSFSYLTAGMTQAQDLAAILAHAQSGSAGVTIVDSHNDSLTLAGLTASTLAAHPTLFHFA